MMTKVPGVIPKKEAPSLDQWLTEAKTHPDSHKVGMYLTHNGTVRETPRAMVREGVDEGTRVKGCFLAMTRKKWRPPFKRLPKGKESFTLRFGSTKGSLHWGMTSCTY